MQHYFEALGNKCLAYVLTTTSHQQKILLSQEGQLNYGNFHSDSENETTTSRKMNVNNVGGSPEPRIQKSITTYAGIDFRTGQYLLVKLETTMGRKQSVFKYLVVSQSCVDDDDEIRVMFLKSLDKTKKTYRIDENDVSFSKKFQILDILPEPTMKTTGDRIFYEFNNSIDVLEKK
ncbi:hypothetical protein HHI36_019737 [Cryptolaemus montrouzieri]|uniref:Uncharacterized protein n=1 Tax=Cryptolaemus montrouzieri TaxID=559131 RepID=A0ABD2N9R9_9CUCU